MRDEPGAQRVEAALTQCRAVMSWINLGEVHYIATRTSGAARAAEAIELARREVDLELPDPDLVITAAKIKVGGRLSYADCFAVATAERHGAPLMTGDPEIIVLKRSGLETIDLRPG